MADPLAAVRARLYAASLASPAETLRDPNDPENWGVDPDDIYDRSREDHL